MERKSVENQLIKIKQEIISKLPENCFVRPDYELRINEQIKRARRGINIIYEYGEELIFNGVSFSGKNESFGYVQMVVNINRHINNCKIILEEENNSYLED